MDRVSLANPRRCEFLGPRLVLRVSLQILGLSLLIGELHGASVAVIPGGPDVNFFSDALTASLSRMSNVVAVERTEIERVFREQQLSLMQPRSLVRAGHLLNAKGVVILEQRVVQQTSTLAVRMVAMAPGVIIDEQEFPLPLRDLTEWATRLAARINRLVPRLSTTTNEALAVSITALRSSVSTASGVARERELTTMLRLRLSQEPSVFLLERKSMEALETEKQIGPGEEPFWNGAAIIEGAINRDVVSEGRITINARVSRPKERPVDIAISGSQLSPAAVIDELARKILETLGQRSGVSVWNAVREAEEFLSEAQWGSSWGLWAEVANNSDAAWFLGQRTPLVGAYRVASRARLCLGMRGPASYDYVGQYGFRLPARPEILPSLARVIEIYQESFPQFIDATNATSLGWGSLGLDLLLVSARVLDRFQEHPEFAESYKAELRDVRSVCRDLNMLLLTNRNLGLTGWTRNLQGLPTVSGNTKNGPVSSLALAWLDAGGVWFESPEDALNMYRKFLGAADYWQTRRALLNFENFSERPIPLAGWTPNHRARLRNYWCKFARDMTSSHDPQVRLDGWRLILTYSSEPAALEEAAEKMQAEAVRSGDSLSSVRVDAPVAVVLSNALLRIARWGVPESERRIERVLSAASTRLDESGPERSYLIWKKLVADLQNPSLRTYAFSPPKAAPSAEHIAELITELERIEREKSRWPVRDHLERLQAYAPPVVAAKAPGTPPANKETGPSRGMLEFSRVWHLENARWPSDQSPDPALYRQPLLGASWQEGNLWLDVGTHGPSHYGARPKLAAVRLDPVTMESEAMVVPFESFNVPAHRYFLVVSNQLFVAVAGHLWRRNSAGQWNSFALPIDQGATLYRWGQQLVLSAAGVLLAVVPETGEVRILASMRRNPPVSVLDRRQLNQVPLAVWPDNTLCASVQGEVWRWDAARNDWRIFVSATNCVGQSIELQPNGIFLRQSTGNPALMQRAGFRSTRSCDGLLLGGWRPHRTDLDCYTWAPPQIRVRTLTNVVHPSRWQHPADTYPHDCQAQFDGMNIWVFPAPFMDAHFESSMMDQYGKPIGGQTTRIPTTILFLDASRNETVELAIRFSGPARSFAEAYQEEHAQGRHHAEFIYTEKGLALVLPPRGLVFWASRDEVAASVAAARKFALPAKSRSDNGPKGAPDDVRDKPSPDDSKR